MDAPAQPPLPQNQSPHLEAAEAALRELVEAVTVPTLASRRVGRPPVLTLPLLWAGLLVCILRGFSAQRNLWQLLTLHGVWQFPRLPVTEQAVYARLATVPVAPLSQLFTQITAVLRQRHAAVDDVGVARFATEILALDHCRLEAVQRKLKLFRALPRGDAQLLPGQLAALFDVRRQLFAHVEFLAEPLRNEKAEVSRWLDHLRPGTLLLFDLGFYAFAWFDALTEAGIHFVSRQRQKISYKLLHCAFDGVAGPCHLRDSLIYLGAYRADRAAQPVRLIEVTCGDCTYRYLTNVLEPHRLSAADVIVLYRRRWDLESAFKFLKSQLNLFLVMSGQTNTVQLQVWASLLVAQAVWGLRNELATRTGAALREVSLPLLLRWLPELARRADAPWEILVERGRAAGLIRPFRGRAYQLPEVAPTAYTEPPARPPPRKPRYAGKRGRSTTAKPGPRKRTRSWATRARRTRHC